ncbi:MAG: CHRD domain-containing protein, partial [Bacteroidia bacterium]|nr:CHRD domain-containing protein [Bacteroidia bacterium]
MARLHHGSWDVNDNANQPLTNFIETLRNLQPGEEAPLYFNIHTNEFRGGEIRGQIGTELFYDRLFSFGARSFTIWNTAGEVVFDSGDEFEQIIAQQFPDDFNANNTENDSFDNRSDNKGPEPEAVTIGEINGRTYAFVGLERIGGIMVYDITDPASAEFVNYVNNRDFSVEDVEANLDDAGDLGPEGVVFVPAADSPNGQPLLIVSNEISGTVSLYGIEDAAEETFTLQVLHASDLEGGVEAIESAPNFAAIVDTLE